jgi:hypothetical protein
MFAHDILDLDGIYKVSLFAGTKVHSLSECGMEEVSLAQHADQMFSV